MKISIVGLGFVGLSLTSVLSSKGNDILGIDADENKCKNIQKGKSPFFEPDLEKLLRIGLKKKLKISTDFSLIKNSDIIFVTVGTPQRANGSIELSMIKSAVKSIGKVLKNDTKNPIIFIKSTVTPGTMQKTVLPILEKESCKKAGKDFGLISNPEFLQESTAIRDTKFPHVVVLGGYETKYMKKAKKFYSKIHPGIPIISTNHQTAEMIKYANNSFLATKISFINQLSNICQNIPGANIDDIAKTIAVFSAFTEGLQLFASFAILLNFPRQNKMKGMGQIVTWSVRDETLHCNSMIKLFRTFIDENPKIWTPQLKKEIYEACRTIISHEDAFINLAFEMGPITGLTADEVKQYIRWIGNRWLIQLGLEPIYKVDKNPLTWLDTMLNAVEHMNFFEGRATEYSKASTKGNWSEAFS